MTKDSKIQDTLLQAEARGIQLGFFITNLDIGDEYKEVLLALIEKMPPKVLDRFYEIMEAQYLQQQTKDIDEQFANALQDWLDQYNQAKEQIDELTAEEVDKLTKQLEK